MTRIESLQELLEFFFKQGQTHDRNGWNNLVNKNGVYFEKYLKELSDRHLIKRKERGEWFIDTDGINYYNIGGFFEEERKQKELEQLSITSTKSVIETVAVAKEANKISIDANKIAGNSLTIAKWAFVVSAAAFVVSIIAICCHK